MAIANFPLNFLFMPIKAGGKQRWQVAAASHPLPIAHRQPLAGPPLVVVYAVYAFMPDFALSLFCGEAADFMVSLWHCKIFCFGG
jgi:hypothetical protein